MIHIQPETCPRCGRPLDAHNRHTRFRLPDPVLALPEQERTAGVWMTEADPNRAVMMQVPNVGAFVRCLLPVKLTEGFTVTFGLWLAVHPDDLQRSTRVWRDASYADLNLDGWLGNALPKWGLLAAPAVARVLDIDQTPYVVESTDPLLAEVLQSEWSHDEVLSALPA